MKPSIIISTSVFAGTTIARLYKRNEYETAAIPLIAPRADASSTPKETPIVAYPTGTGNEEEGETLSTDAGAPATVDTATSSTSTENDIPYTYDCLPVPTFPLVHPSTLSVLATTHSMERDRLSRQPLVLFPLHSPQPTLSDMTTLQSPPPQQNMTMQSTTTFEQPIVTCGPDICSHTTMIDSEAPPMMTETPVQVDGVENLTPLMGLVALAGLIAI
ncbi:surface sp1 [Fusarium longipes]|uniref:Surface sp1 n=1 Tax=Fusarium longipes TaxID=694270 RepID=A0A395SW44_9HYPO|nr:surface sp1 [Fusarium longipes]